jgi:glycosyltransferase involved in cell wall biosynthesis
MGSIAASIVLLTYNQEQFVEEAFLSLLKQNMDDLEIIVSDDNSSDGTWERIQEIADAYSGPKKVILSRNTTNLGIVDNYFSAVEKSSGDLIFMAAGDDISLPNRCSETICFWEFHNKKYDLVAADAFDMAYDGTILGPKKNDDLETWTIEKWFERRPFFFGASQMVTRRLLNLSTLNSKLLYEDQCLVFRAILMGGAIRLPANLVCHRQGGMTQAMGFKFGKRRSNILRDTTNEFAEVQQFLSDATLLGRRAMVEPMVVQRANYLTPIMKLFAGPLSIKAFREFWCNSEISTEDKRRYSRYYFLYPVLAIAHWVRDVLRAIRESKKL